MAPASSGPLGIESGSITYNLGSGPNGIGYTITGLRSLTAWGDSGRINPQYSVSYSLDGVSFSVASGELLGLIGPNGAGKTTLLHTVIGVIRPNQGSVAVAGRDITRLATDARARLGLALTHQIVRPFRSMSVLDNVVLGCHRHLNYSSGPYSKLGFCLFNWRENIYWIFWIF